jgi:DNA-binding transcriptional MerR regulator
VRSLIEVGAKVLRVTPHQVKGIPVDKAPDAFRTISEAAEELDVPQHVLRFWESRFREIKPMKRGGGRRYYRPDDVNLLRGIRHLLYGEGYTIRGVQRILRDQGVKFVQSVWEPGAPQPAHQPADEMEAEDAAGMDIPASASASADRSRGLFGLLPSLLSENEDERPVRPVAPEFAPEPRAPVAGAVPPPAAANPSPENMRKLTAALHELTECRKLLAAALDPSG